ncbi:MAG TPA: hypothetical protein VJA16_10900 [Thermoanaerobaculia bacterium]
MSRPRSRPGAASLLPAVACLAVAGLAVACATGGGAQSGRPPAPPPPGAAAVRPAPPRARQAVDESYQVPARELSDDLLRRMIGIATISVGVAAGAQEQAPAIYDNDGDRFTASGNILLRGTRPISVYRVGTDPIVNRSRAVARRYPVLERKGMYVEVALDPSGRRTAWLRRTPEGAFPNSVDYVDFNDAGSFRCYQLDLYYLAGGAPRQLFEKPDPAALSTILSPKPGAPGFLGGDVVPLQRRGNFLEIAALRGLDDPRTGIGWVELKDAKGRLTVWFSPGPEC